MCLDKVIDTSSCELSGIGPDDLNSNHCACMADTLLIEPAV